MNKKVVESIKQHCKNAYDKTSRWFFVIAFIGGVVIGFTAFDESSNRYWRDWYEIKGDPNDVGKYMYRDGYDDCLANKRRLYGGG